MMSVETGSCDSFVQAMIFGLLRSASCARRPLSHRIWSPFEPSGEELKIANIILNLSRNVHSQAVAFDGPRQDGGCGSETGVVTFLAGGELYRDGRVIGKGGSEPFFCFFCALLSRFVHVETKFISEEEVSSIKYSTAFSRILDHSAQHSHA